jgi:hypothetical protein
MRRDRRQRDPSDPQRRPLRRAWDMTFLSQNGEAATVYEAQFSCIIIGIHQHLFTVLSLSDSFFENPDDGKDIVFGSHKNDQSYSALREAVKEQQGDPAVLGSTELRYMPTSPLQYCIQVLKCRLARNYHEMKRIVDEMGIRIQNLQEKLSDALSMANRHWFFDKGIHKPSTLLNAREIRNQVYQLRDVSAQIGKTLTSLVNEYERFASESDDLVGLNPFSLDAQNIAAILNEYRRLIRQLEGDSDRSKMLLEKVRLLNFSSLPI